jgi:16S rRNA (cytidine1402-2'-O)-methyltransferase
MCVSHIHLRLSGGKFHELLLVSGTLYVIATPIGNLGDLSPRARETLSIVDLIAAEDTRHTSRLLSHIGVKKPLKALHDFNESAALGPIIDMLVAGSNVALVSDAGTPLLSDPGYRLVLAAREHGCNVVPIPGPSALTAVLSVAGLPSDRFSFEGFLPARSAARMATLQKLAAESRTIVFFESVHRIDESLQDMARVFGAFRPAFIGRELTKLHEQTVCDTLGGLLARLASGEITAKGEFVVVIKGSPEAENASLDLDALILELAAVLPTKQAAGIAARLSGEKRNVVYARMLELKHHIE